MAQPPNDKDTQHPLMSGSINLDPEHMPNCGYYIRPETTSRTVISPTRMSGKATAIKDYYRHYEDLSEGARVRIVQPGHSLYRKKGKVVDVRAWFQRALTGHFLMLEYDVRVRVSPWWRLRPKYEIVTLRRGDLDVLDEMTGKWLD